MTNATPPVATPQPVHIDMRGYTNICAVARHLVQEGTDPNAMVYAWRGETQCFKPMPLGRWAGLTVRESDTVSVRFGKHRPMPEHLRQSVMRGAPCSPAEGLPDVALA